MTSDKVMVISTVPVSYPTNTVDIVGSFALQYTTYVLNAELTGPKLEGLAHSKTDQDKRERSWRPNELLL